MFLLNKETALIQTLDFLTPIADAPYDFGRIAAANALSDVYAMGGTPVTAMNIVCFPSKDLPEEVLTQTLKGGLEKINESGAALAGGHSVDDPEFKYGLSVTGIVHPERVITNSSAMTGDKIIITKPIGTGILATAIKAGVANHEDERAAIESMARLNKDAAAVMGEFRVSACTDVTGFGLAGHLFEMAAGSKKQFSVESNKIPLLDQADMYARMGMLPAGAHKNRNFFEKGIQISGSVPRSTMDLLFDPQTSGGLVFCVDPDEAQACLSRLKSLDIKSQIIGQVQGEHGCGFLDIF